MLLLFCAILFFHTAHAAVDITDATPTLESHDCHLCQQGLEPLVNAISLFNPTCTVYSADITLINSLVVAVGNYVLPLLRAPPVKN